MFICTGFCHALINLVWRFSKNWRLKYNCHGIKMFTNETCLVCLNLYIFDMLVTELTDESETFSEIISCFKIIWTPVANRENAYALIIIC